MARPLGVGSAAARPAAGGADDDLSAGARRDPGGLEIRPQGRVPRRHGAWRHDRHRQRPRCGAAARQGRRRPRRRGGAGPCRLLAARRRSHPARHLRGEGVRRRRVADGQVGGVRDAAQARAQRHPVHRRRPVDGPPHRRAHPLQGPGRRPLRRRARHRRHAAHGARLDLGHRFARHRLGQLDERLHHRPQVLRQCHGRLLRAQQERPRPPQGRDLGRARQAPQCRHGRRRRHQHRDRGRHARRHGGARAPPQRLRRDRAHVLRGQARGHDGRRLGLLPAQVGQGRQAQGRGELPREIQGARVSARRHGVRHEGGSRRQGHDEAARPLQCGQSRRCARSQPAEKRHRAQVSRPARPRRPDAGRTRRSLARAPTASC